MGEGLVWAAVGVVKGDNRLRKFTNMSIWMDE